ncbi:flagellar basal body-associated FliL family protein [Humidesulfovibrio sp.]|uniref:flagellar basal body-associated FliL family protein n=1 Tax=Humidesulfovibrio sp. TaxID=2910988 RepID=UPI00280AB7BB|nr:flagellar basal body-associated FliL family protein [Humidesulfovibrio sp.]
MVPDPTEEANPSGAGRPDNNDVMLDTSEPSRATQKVDLDLDDAPFLEEEEEVKPEPQTPKEAVSLTEAEAEKPAPRDRKKLIIIGAAALVLVLALGVAAKFLFFKAKPATVAEPSAHTAPQDNATQAEAAPPELPEIQLRLEPFWVEQKGEGDEVRFLIARILLGTHEPAVAKDFESRMMQGRNAIYYYLKNKDVQFLADEKNAEKLKSELLLVVNQYVSDGKFETLLFEEYVVK